MGQCRPKRQHPTTKSYTLPSSPNHSSSSSSDFEFTISAAPRKSSAAAVDLCPADELFYKGQLLPLHPPTRLSMVRTLLLSSASTSSSSDTTTTTASRDSTASHSDCGSSSGRPSSVAEELELKRLTRGPGGHVSKPPSKYFSLPKLFRKEQKHPAQPPHSGRTMKRVSSGAREMIRRYLKKVKPFYEKLSHKHKTSPPAPPPASRITAAEQDRELNCPDKEKYRHASILHSFSGNLRLYPVRARSYVSSCPSSMGSSPSHGKSGFANGLGYPRTGRVGMYNSDASSMEELQSAIQGAIAHCKNSMLQNTAVVSNEV